MKNENVLGHNIYNYHYINLQCIAPFELERMVNDTSILKWQYIVDSFNFYNRVLTPEEIRANYNKIIGVQQ